MAYTKTQWVNGQAPAIDADNLNKIENGIYVNAEQIAILLERTTPTSTSVQNTTKKAGALEMSKTGNVVTFSCPGDFVSLPAGNTDYVTIPEGFRPNVNYTFVISNNNTRYVTMFVYPSGLVRFYNYGSASSGAVNGAFSGSWISN